MIPAAEEPPPGKRLRDRRTAAFLSQEEVAGKVSELGKKQGAVQGATMTKLRLNEIEMLRGKPASLDEIRLIEAAIDQLPDEPDDD